MKFVSILLACLAAIALAAEDPKECEGERTIQMATTLFYQQHATMQTSRRPTPNRVIGVPVLAFSTPFVIISHHFLKPTNLQLRHEWDQH